MCWAYSKRREPSRESNKDLAFVGFIFQGGDTEHVLHRRPDGGNRQGESQGRKLRAGWGRPAIGGGAGMACVKAPGHTSKELRGGRKLKSCGVAGTAHRGKQGHVIS